MEPCQRNTVRDITEQGHSKISVGGGGGYMYIRDKLSQNIMFNFLHDYLLLYKCHSRLYFRYMYIHVCDGT